MNDREKTLVWTYFALVWWAESINSGFFKSDFFKQMNFDDSFVKKQLESDGVAQGALLLPSLYVALVIPKETIFEEHKKTFQKIDQTLCEKMTVIHNSYPDDEKEQVTKRLRNAVAHSKVHIEDDFLIFSDYRRRNNSECELTAKIKLSDAGWLVSELQNIILCHVKRVQQRQSPL